MYPEIRKRIMAKKLCALCREKPATVPDRAVMGRPINRFCLECHKAKLLGDFERILIQRAKEKKSFISEGKPDRVWD